MKRRTFIKISTAGAATLVIPKPFLKTYGNPRLVSEFLNPPESGRAFTWWHWMNGNVTADGITRDLEFMHNAGLGGFQIFQVGVGIPKGPVKFGGNEWFRLLQHAAREAKRLGLEYDMMNGGGWSSSGGPWITPELGMQQFTWSETHVQGGKTINILLPQPYTKLNFYRDAYVLAFPSIAGESKSMRELLSKVTSNQGNVDIIKITNGNLDKGISIKPDNKGGQVHLEMEFKYPYKAQSIILYGSPMEGGRFGRGGNSISLESSKDGKNYKKVCDLQLHGRRSGKTLEYPSVANFSSVNAKYFRLTATNGIHLYNIQLNGSPRIVEWPLKADFTHRSRVVAGERLSPTEQIPKESIIESR